MSTSTFPGEQSVDHAPLPTARTLRQRNNLVVQAWRFAMINLRMARMIRRSHHHPTR
jgi:hypothetical protein